MPATLPAAVFLALVATLVLGEAFKDALAVKRLAAVVVIADPARFVAVFFIV